MTSDPIKVKQILLAPIETVWNAITDPNQMNQWFFENIRSFSPMVGFETSFNVQASDKVFGHVWRVTEVVIEEKLTYDWSYEGYEGVSSVTWELISRDNSTYLALIHRGTERFPEDVDAFSRANCTDGWKYLIQVRLKGFLTLNEQKS